ncbi:MAG: oligosaccharide flippase family protein [Clostridia bacterium]|nr:oligosaccharide flippase family protein [Clostridia bacterium]
MSREKELIKNTGIITIGKICTQMISFFLLPLYTAVFSTEEFGIVDLFNTIVAFLLPILTIQIDQALFRFLIDARDNEEDKTRLITSAFLLVIIGIIAYSVIFACIEPFISNEYKYFLLINVLANILSTLMLQVARGLGHNKEYSIGSFIVAAFTVILNVLFIVVLKLGVSGMFWAIFIANIMATIYLIFSKKTYKYIVPKMFSKKLLKAMCKYSAALIPNAVSWWVINVSDRAIISSMLSVAANGIYAAANKFSGMYINAYNIFNIAWTESAAIHINDQDKDEYFSKTINTGLKVFACFSLIIIGVTPFVFPWLINEKFGDAYNQIPLLMLSSLFNVGVGLVSVIYVAKKRSFDISKTSFIAAVINIIVNVLLIKYIGLYAASISTIVAYLAMFIYRAIDCRRYVKFKLDVKMVMALTTAFTLTFVMYYINISWLNVVMLVGVILFSILCNKNSFKSIGKILKRKFSKGEN